VRRRLAPLQTGLWLGIFLLAVPGWAGAQPKWISTDGSPPGTPPEILFDARGSSNLESFFDIYIHGFYVEPIVGSDQRTYYKIQLPGHAQQIQQVGAPELPAVQIPLALPVGVDAVRLGQRNFDIYAESDILIAPEFIPGMDQGGQDPPPREPEFALDEVIYFGSEAWPTSDGTGIAAAEPFLGSINGAMMTLYPMHWNPESGELQVWRQARVQFAHPGTPQNSLPITKERLKLAEQVLLNWDVMDRYFPVNNVTYEADYLFIYPEGYREELLPLIDQKWARGFFVAEEAIGVTSNTCASIQTLIQNWYNSTPENRDKYCLLIGDAGVIPLCTSPALGMDYPSGVNSDDPYASVNGLDLDEEVWLGRLSVDSETDCTNQVTKILAYEDFPQLFGNYEEALLVAHREGAPGKYVGAHESVRTATYAVPPTFTTLYGNNGAVSDADVTAQINEGLGLVAYRGHGNSGAWTTWNTMFQDYNTTDVSGLANTLEPVVWSFACTNQDLTVGDCIGEQWMERSDFGAVSHYGATVASYTDQNHELDRRMFRGVYHLGLTTQSHAIWYAELYMNVEVGPENAWMYLLLGDPDMQIRRRAPLNLAVDAPLQVGTCTEPPCGVNITVLDYQGQPVPGALVAIFKPNESGAGEMALLGGEEVFDNRYTDANGEATIPASPTTPGQIQYSVQDEAGNVAVGTIEVTTGSVAVDRGTRGTLAFRALPSVTRSSTFLSFGHILTEPATVKIYDLSGRVVRTFDAAAGVGGVTWDGRNAAGSTVPSGLYFAKFADGHARDVTRVFITR
jgi:hypothetical protein